MKISQLLAGTLCLTPVTSKINRKQVLSQFNPIRYASSNSTPMQVGNGDFAFGVDVTGLQTFMPYGTLSSWGWHNFSLPATPGQTAVTDFTGLDWWVHGRLVNYNQPNPAEPLISNWLIKNPQRINLGRIGFSFGPNQTNITEKDLTNIMQTLDLYSGTITSTFSIFNSKIMVITTADPETDTIGIQVESELLKDGKLGVFFDYPYPDINKFDAPFVGVWNSSTWAKHTTSLQARGNKAVILHDIDATRYWTTIQWESDGEVLIEGPKDESHRYILSPSGSSKLDLSVNYSPTSTRESDMNDGSSIAETSFKWWKSYWETGAFIDLTGSKNISAIELQRRIVTSQYHLALNAHASDPPQESGLVNIGWYGKFHLEMIPWHLLHWHLWSKSSFIQKSVPRVYTSFLESSKKRAAKMGYKGARWGKMSDPTGRSAPGEINSLLIWQQPHVMLFAEMEWRNGEDKGEVLEKWANILDESAEFMVDFAWWNSTTARYDLGPPMYPVSENTNPNVTLNPTFELAYWSFGLQIASQWRKRQNLPVPEKWTHVLQHLSPLPVKNGTYELYEGIPNMWIDPISVTDHPALLGIFGLLPTPTNPALNFNLTILQGTAEKVSQVWDFKNLFGWDFPMLAMNAARMGDSEKAVKYLLDPEWNFDDIGMPVGGPRVATPYFPSSGGLLWAVGMMGGGWDGANEVKRWPNGWTVECEGFRSAL
ncbi:Six-hairpin glycosidase-like protein [Tricladium varicosporioides]|nr:Six-hairpin glycosidase-like protein [Hymenoscyphus varicosporioides]